MEALAAPIALYPDQLLAKVMIASTYPMEVVEAARWRQQNKGLSGAALESALAGQTWDDSVKELTYTPEVLDMMDKQIAWAQKLGDAVLTDQAGMLKAVQRLRAKAQANGKLTDTPQQKVVTENQTIIIQPAEPEKVYVPYYDSSSIYGPWDYGYPAYYWPPPYGYGYGAGLGFVTGAIIGAAFWNNNCNWGGGNLQVNNFNNFNNINNIRGGQNWQHNANHRRGAAYGNQGLRDRYGRGTQAGANGRRDFRGFDNGLGNRGGLGDRGGLANNGGLGGRDGIGGNNGLGNRGGLGGAGGLGNSGLGSRGGISNTGFDRGGFGGIGNGGQTRSFSSRGSSSLGSARSSGFRSSGGGGFRGGGGGGFRGGGGGRGGGGRRR
ncbi:MAG TPA: DUF3300 domain-containing protein [Rhizomicrobium sp.]|nr:DUF3300 domain-containing protein [Rhizomicrobium sp.]